MVDIDSTHDHPKATGSATRTGKSKAGGIDATVTALKADVPKQIAIATDLMTNSKLRDQINALINANNNTLAEQFAAKTHTHTPPPVDPPPVTPPTSTVTVKTINDLYAALANNEVDVTLAPGDYSGGFYMDSRFAPRTKPCVIHTVGVTMNGGGITHRGGAHNLEWPDTITFANWSPNQTGVLMFGGWDEPAAHDIIIRKPKILASVKRTLEGNTSEHGVYFSIAQGGIYNVLIEDIDVDATGPMGLATAIHADHGDASQTAHDITIRRTVFRGNGTQGSAIQDGLILWTPSYRNWLFDGATLTNTNGNAIRVQSTNSSGIVFKDIVSTGTRMAPFYSPQGANPTGVTFVNCNLH